MPTKQYFATSDFNRHSLPADYVLPKPNAFRKFPANCGVDPLATVSSKTHQKHPNFVDESGALQQKAFAAGVNRRKDCEMAIAAVPLRSLPTVDVKGKPDKSASSHVKDYDEVQKTTNITSSTVDEKEELWKHESDKLAAVIAEAKEFINLFESKNQLPSSQSDEDPFGKRLKVDDEVSSAELISEDSEDEVSVLSPVEWNSLQQCSNHKDSEDFDECSVISKREQDEALKMSSVDVEHIATNSTNCNNELECFPNHKELINLEIVPRDHPRGRKVMRALKVFKEEYNKLSADKRESKPTIGPHYLAARRVKEMGMLVFNEKPFGHIPGIEIGDEFSFRAELAIVGLNCQNVAGIDFVTLGAHPYATCVVDSGRYENEAKDDDILIYSGQGGNPNVSVSCPVAADQKLEKGNLALMNSMKMAYPVRVVRKRKCPMESNLLGKNNKRNYTYVYDGLFKVNRFWQDRQNESYKLVFKFELQRLQVQTNDKVGKEIQAATEVCVLEDVSQGKEKFKVRVVNEVDDSLPLPFTYITSIINPNWHQPTEPIGCNCIGGCSDSVQCPCVIKNGGEIPFTETGAIMRAKPKNAVRECGPSCKCPPSCMNRVSQHGPHFGLEIFKIKSMGWGVRCRNAIKPGSFICEYIGELLGEKEADQRTYNDEYLFDIFRGESQEDDFALDAAKCGNIGRFINHGCEPNLFAQKVLFDNDDERMPHIMFFASKDIPQRQELRYDYNYKTNRVCDPNGNAKRKACHCGSRKCTRRLY